MQNHLLALPNSPRGLAFPTENTRPNPVSKRQCENKTLESDTHHFHFPLRRVRLLSEGERKSNIVSFFHGFIENQFNVHIEQG